MTEHPLFALPTERSRGVGSKTSTRKAVWRHDLFGQRRQRALRCARRSIWVGYGGGALGLGGGSLAVVDAGAKLSEIAVDAHPESFQLETSGPRILVNLPKSQKIVVVDRTTRKVIGAWKTGGAESNFPMALDETNHRLMVVCRSPARLLVFDTSTGRIVTTQPRIGDSDDVFYDSARKRIYAIGGEGGVWVYEQQDPDRYAIAAKVATVKGARTGFFARSRAIVRGRPGERDQRAEIRIFGVQRRGLTGIGLALWAACRARRTRRQNEIEERISRLYLPSFSLPRLPQ